MPVMRMAVTKQAVTGSGQSQQTVPAPEALRLKGPLVGAVLTVLEGVPSVDGVGPVQGAGLIDTGAQSTCVDIEAATRAGLQIRGVGKMTSASHDGYPTPLYAGRLQMAGLDLAGTTMMGGNLAPQGLIALIGRDLLEHCMFIYDGHAGTYNLIW